MNKSIRLLAVITAVCFAAAFAQATIYTWIGGTDNDWSNAANWDGNGIPAVDVNGSVVNSANTITIQNGTFKPTANVPSFPVSGAVASTVPLFVIKSGAALEISSYAINPNIGAQNRTEATIESGGSLTWNATGAIYMGYNTGTQTYNIDGTFTINVPNLNVGYQSGRVSVINLDGGTVNFSGSRIYGTRTATGDFTALHSQINLNNGSTFSAAGAMFINMEGTSVAGSDPTLVFDIQDIASSVTAKYGSSVAFSFMNLTQLEAGLGTYFISSTLGNDKLVATDNGNGTFTITAIPEPATIGILGLGAAAMMLIRRMRA